ncbi:MAG: cysteine desulfurase [Actinobacteria bacterium]|nr:cysteine desulfurase [Actinomycetota bacterium]
MSGVYLDAAATAPLRPEARAAMLAVLEAGQANPSSVHSPGHRASVVLREAREAIAGALQARGSEVVFTSGGTEANNLAVIGLALANPRGRHIVTSAIEHPSVLESCRYLERVFGFEVTEAPVDRQGRIDPHALAALLRPDTTLVSIGLANGEIGTVQQVGEIAGAAHAAGALVHTDAVQAAASLPVSFAADGWPGAVDAMTIASHKFGGPQGAGALLLRSGTSIEPLMHGGGQELGRRSGTENVAAIAGFAAAVAESARQPGARALALVAARDELVESLLAAVPECQLTGHPTERLPGHASFVVEGVSGESLLVALDVAGVAASSGSACAAGRDEPSAALLAIGLTPELAQTAIRFTLPAPIDAETIAEIVRIVAAEVRSARARRP